MLGMTDSYGKMLKRIFLITLVFSIISWYLILLSYPELNNNINKLIYNFFKIDSSIKIYDYELPFSYAVPVLLACICRVFMLHNIISDIFKIRYKYDINNILLPLAVGVGYDVNDINKIANNRKKLMNRTFYEYASYNSNSIDRHLISKALDSFTWLWGALEGLSVSIVALFICIFSVNILSIFIFVFIICTLIIFYKVQMKRCKEYTKNEIDEILDNIDRKNEILGVFNAL